MGAWVVDVTCPKCGSPLALVNRTGGNLRQLAVTACSTCAGEWVLELTLSHVREPSAPSLAHPNPAECGTPSGWRRHNRNHEPACDACRRAHNADEKTRQARLRHAKRARVLVGTT